MIDVTPGLLEQSPTLAKAIAEVLEETAQRVQRDGFGQHAFWDPGTGKYCTRGHFTQVVLDRYRGRSLDIDGVDLWKLVIAGCDMVMSLHLGAGVAVWNDHPGRTEEEVVAALTESANEARIWCPA